jgi:hypothetical protein
MTDDELRSLRDGSGERRAADPEHYVDLAMGPVKHQIDLLARAVARLDVKVARHFTGLHDQLDRGFAETQALIRSLHER